MSSSCDIETEGMSLLWEESFFGFDDSLSGFFFFLVSFIIVFYLFIYFCTFCPDWPKSINWNKKKNKCANICKWCNTLLWFLQQIQQVILAFLWVYWLYNIIRACKDFFSLTYFLLFSLFTWALPYLAESKMIILGIISNGGKWQKSCIIYKM